MTTVWARGLWMPLPLTAAGTALQPALVPLLGVPAANAMAPSRAADQLVHVRRHGESRGAARRVLAAAAAQLGHAVRAATRRWRGGAARRAGKHAAGAHSGRMWLTRRAGDVCGRAGAPLVRRVGRRRAGASVRLRAGPGQPRQSLAAAAAGGGARGGACGGRGVYVRVCLLACTTATPPPSRTCSSAAAAHQRARLLRLLLLTHPAATSEAEAAPEQVTVPVPLPADCEGAAQRGSRGLAVLLPAARVREAPPALLLRWLREAEAGARCETAPPGAGVAQHQVCTGAGLPATFNGLAALSAARMLRRVRERRRWRTRA